MSKANRIIHVGTVFAECVTHKAGNVRDSFRELIGFCSGNVQMVGEGNRTILLVEDYKDSREMIRFLLEDLGYRIMEARNGKEALELASKELPDLVLTDFNLPDIDGTTLIKRLRTLENKNSHIPIIMLTAQDPGELYELAMAAGCTTFLTKPVSFGVLEKKISTLLEECRELNGSVNDISH